MSTLLLALDLIGTFVFALSGAAAGIRHRLDLFGVLVLSLAAGTAGGMLRDVLIGATPPPAINDWRYITAALLAGLILFRWAPSLARFRGFVLILDAAGLGLFAVSGAMKALTYGLSPVGAVVLGGLTGIGGGMLRDMLVREVPTVFRSELYAVAALAGATVVVAGDRLDLPSGLTTAVGAALCFLLRVIAIRRGWKLPSPRHTLDLPSSTD